MKNLTSPSRAFSLGLYLVVVFALSWPFQIAGAMLAGNLLPRYILTSISMLMVTVGTFICGRFVFRDGFTGAGWQWGRPKHYLAVIGLALFLWGVPSLIALRLGRSVPSVLSGEQIVWVFVLLFVTLIPAFGEEFGWRGYMLPRLARRFTLRKAVLIHAFIWWAWHLPILIGTAAQNSVNIPTIIGTVFLGIIPGILHGVIFAYIWSASRSLAVATVYHAAYDGVRDSLQMTLGFGAMTVLWANLFIMILGIVLLYKGSWRNLETTSVSGERAA